MVRFPYTTSSESRDGQDSSNSGPRQHTHIVANPASVDIPPTTLSSQLHEERNEIALPVMSGASPPSIESDLPPPSSQPQPLTSPTQLNHPDSASLFPNTRDKKTRTRNPSAEGPRPARVLTPLRSSPVQNLRPSSTQPSSSSSTSPGIPQSRSNPEPSSERKSSRSSTSAIKRKPVPSFPCPVDPPSPTAAVSLEPIDSGLIPSNPPSGPSAGSLMFSSMPHVSPPPRPGNATNPPNIPSPRPRQTSSSSTSSLPPYLRRALPTPAPSSSPKSSAPLNSTPTSYHPPSSRPHIHRSSNASDHSSMNIKRLLSKPASSPHRPSFLSESGSDSDVGHILHIPGRMNLGTGSTSSLTDKHRSSLRGGLHDKRGTGGGDLIGELSNAKGRTGSDLDGYKSAPGAVESIKRVGTRSKSVEKREDIGRTDASKKGATTKHLKGVRSMHTSLYGDHSDQETSCEQERKRLPNVLKRRPNTGPAATATTQVQALSVYHLNPAQSPASSTTSGTPGCITDRPWSAQQGNGGGKGRVLTPASQVVESYRQQEARRNHLILGVSAEQTEHRPAQISANISPISVHKPSGLDHGNKLEDEESATPYYTVFGSTSGKIVAVGSPIDAWGYDMDALENKERYRRRGKSFDEKRPKSARGGPFGAGIGKTLSRKMSGHWKKLPSGDGGEDGNRRDSGLERRSLQEQWTTYHSPDVKVKQASPMSKPAPDGSPSSKGTAGFGESESMVKTACFATESRQKSEPGLLSGGKIWKLMKRLSTGGLRDKYNNDIDAEEPPPVPALPKALHKSSGHHTDDWPNTKEGYPRRRETVTFGRRSPSNNMDPPLKRHATAVAKISGVSATGVVVSAPKLGPNTRSSSPALSDLASLRFSRDVISRSSSISSDDDDIPPVPSTYISKYIIPPSELQWLNDSSGEVTSMSPTKGRPKPPTYEPHSLTQLTTSDDWFLQNSADERPSLPFPRRKPNGTTSVTNTRSTSPAIPTFSNASSINTFGSRKAGPPVVEVPQDIPTTMSRDSEPAIKPPRPTRSTKRPSPAASVPSSRTTSPSREVAIDRPREGSSHLQPSRTSIPSHNIDSSPPSFSPSFSTSRPTTLMYRELNSSDKPQALSEKEKADKWDDLLERSARAGGTLHIGGGELLSDRISYLSSETILN